jgi:hypothetical protein
VSILTSQESTVPKQASPEKAFSLRPAMFSRAHMIFVAEK